jgi:hypothetical protein
MDHHVGFDARDLEDANLSLKADHIFAHGRLGKNANGQKLARSATAYRNSRFKLYMPTLA